ncbi:MAG: 4Fe-4S dicluster domain-containing protein [Bacteroidetes bacterium]|nr:4Fe-4S dicluster domain-containing protein [Bacteroidota bacterium]
MTRQIIFATTFLITLVVFSFTIVRLISFFKLTKKAFPVRNPGKRLKVMFEVAFGQTKIFRKPVIGFIHALVFWGFCVIIIGSIEMITDGLTGSDHALKFLGPVYNFIIASGDIFGFLVAFSIVIFLTRRLFLHIKRFDGVEMKSVSHQIDAIIALMLILLLMVSLIGINSVYYEYKLLKNENIAGYYPLSQLVAPVLSNVSVDTLIVLCQVFWWVHILLIFIFANVLPYSKHFHVFMSVPNVFLSRLDPLGKLPNMENVTYEVRQMLNPNSTFSASAEIAPVERFGIKDVEDVSWKNYLDALACTECGRCTSVCPANLTGKRLSPRKIVMDIRSRMKEKGPRLVQHGKGYNDDKSLLRNYIREEELWACTTCNACAQECPININHPTIIIDMRRYLVMEEGSAPGKLKTMFNNIENNGAPWQYSCEDRLLWARNLEIINN